MNLREPIVIVDDDPDDREIMMTVLKKLAMEREIIFFDNGEHALEYLKDEAIIPFMIFSDINMPIMNGFQLRDKIHEHDGLRSKCLPFIFLTTGGDVRFIWEAYSKNAQGYFIKPNSMKDWRDFFATTIKYWTKSKKPSYDM